MQYIIYFIIFILTASCSSFDDAGKVLRNEKTKTTDEFLIKKEPLIMPPDLNEIPEPETLENKKAENDNEKIKNLLKMPNPVRSDKSNSSTEDLIIDKIRK